MSVARQKAFVQNQVHMFLSVDLETCLKTFSQTNYFWDWSLTHGLCVMKAYKRAILYLKACQAI